MQYYTEVPRYALYATKLLGLRAPGIEWLRYNSFLILYPAGLLLEVSIHYYAFVGNYHGSAGLKAWSLTLPNSLNFAFDPLCK
jgi:very-long-chain (3R)-3-hydroxyacyl-CoA dehydratase